MTEEKPNEHDPTGDDRNDSDVPPGMDTDADEKSALSPEDLDIAESEYVEKLDDNGRYVVSPGNGPPKVPESVTDTAGSSDHRTTPKGQDIDARSSDSQQYVSPEAARTLLADELERSNARYGLDIVARLEGETLRHRTVSDDVIATFENLVRWYAGHVADGTPPDEVVDILLRESTFETSETPNLAQLLEKHRLDGTDTIDSLVAAIRAESVD